MLEDPTMSTVQLQCPVGGECDYKTQSLPYAQAEALLDRHLRFAQQASGGSNSDRKPERFPRPDLKLDSSFEEWSEFLVTWNQYKDEYQLEGAMPASSGSSLLVAQMSFVIVYQDLLAAPILRNLKPSC